MLCDMLIFRIRHLYFRSKHDFFRSWEQTGEQCSSWWSFWNKNPLHVVILILFSYLVLKVQTVDRFEKYNPLSIKFYISNKVNKVQNDFWLYCFELQNLSLKLYHMTSNYNFKAIKISKLETICCHVDSSCTYI